MVTVEMLARSPLLAGMSRGGLERLAGRGIVRSFGKGRILWRVGDQPQGLFMILEGEVKVVRGRGGRQAIIHREGPGGTLGEVPLWSGETYPAMAITTQPTRCVVFGIAVIHDTVRANPELGFAFLTRMAGRVRGLIERLDRLALLDVRARLAHHLLARIDGSGIVTLTGTQTALAEELGTVREVLVRALRSLVQAKLVERIGPRRLRIPNPRSLRDLLTS